MPGRTPHEAYDAFIEPIRRAVSCLAPAHVTTSGFAVGKAHVWTLNRTAGIALDGGLHFEAQMQYELIQWQDQWRVTTRAYRYRFAIAGQPDVFRMHWHPSGDSPFKTPHVHLNLQTQALRSGEALKEHLPSPRISLEEAIQWVIVLGQVKSPRDDWQTVLEETKTRHVRFRSWDRDPASAVEPTGER